MDTMEIDNFTLSYYEDTNFTTDLLLASNKTSQADEEYIHFRDMCRFWVKEVLYPIIMCIGTLGNGVTIAVLTRRRMRSSTNHYLTALAFSDLFYLIFAFTLNLDYYTSLHNHTYFSYSCYATMLTDACSNTSVWLTVAFTIERYVAVCHPIKGKVLCTRSRAKKVVTVVFCTCFLVTLPTLFEWTVVESLGPNNTTTFKKEFSSLGNNETYKKVFYGFTYTSFIFIPLILLTMFNSLLIRSVHQSKSRRRRMTVRKRRNDHAYQENRITVMLIAVVIMFLLCQLPTAATLVYTSTYALDPSANERVVLAGLGNIFNLFMGVNAACNFILYCAFSDKYRRTFVRTFMPCLFRVGSPRDSQSNVNTTYVQSDLDSVIGSFKRGKSSYKRSSSKKNINHGRNTINLKQVNGYNHITNGTNGVHHHENGVNGSTRGRNSYLQVPQDNGVCANDDSIGSDTTQETVFSGSDHQANTPPSVNGKTTTVIYHCDSGHLCNGMDGIPHRKNNNYKQKTEHVISLTSPGGNDHLL